MNGTTHWMALATTLLFTACAGGRPDDAEGGDDALAVRPSSGDSDGIVLDGGTLACDPSTEGELCAHQLAELAPTKVTPPPNAEGKTTLAPQATIELVLPRVVAVHEQELGEAVLVLVSPTNLSSLSVEGGDARCEAVSGWDWGWRCEVTSLVRNAMNGGTKPTFRVRNTTSTTITIYVRSTYLEVAYDSHCREGICAATEGDPPGADFCADPAREGQICDWQRAGDASDSRFIQAFDFITGTWRPAQTLHDERQITLRPYMAGIRHEYAIVDFDIAGFQDPSRGPISQARLTFKGSNLIDVLDVEGASRCDVIYQYQYWGLGHSCDVTDLVHRTATPGRFIIKNTSQLGETAYFYASESGSGPRLELSYGKRCHAGACSL